MIAGIETFIIFLLFVAGSAIFNWWQKRGQTEDWSQLDKPGAPPRQPRKTDWEEDLRRMLEMESPAAPPPSRPPPMVQEAPTRRAPAIPVYQPPKPPPIPILTHVPVEAAEGEGTIVHSHRAPLVQSSAGYERASHIEESVAAHIKDVTTHHVAMTYVRRHFARSAEVEAVLTQFRSPHSARQAVMAAMILAPPKGLE